VLAGGFGSAVLEVLHEADCPAAVERIGWPDRFVEHGTNVDVLRAAYGLSFEDIYRRVKERYRNLSTAAVEIDA
jgi:1-deoxy-D-xylulose-5-phosphate synthase